MIKSADHNLIKNLAIGLGIIAVLLIVYTSNRAQPVDKLPSNPPDTSNFPNIRREQLTLIGLVLCLPHTDTSGPQTLECAYGLKTDTGKYYALDFNLSSRHITDVKTGVRVSASGIFTPIEMLSTDIWNKYPIEGIFSVTDSYIEL